MKGKFWRKALAAAMGLLIVSGSVPIKPVSDIFGDMAITANAETATTDTFGALNDGRYTLESKTYTLTDDVNTAGYIYVPEGVTATIDLNGHTIDRGLTSEMTNGSVIIVEGTLTITDASTGGKIQGGYDAGVGYGYSTSCVKVLEGATFNLQGGTLIGRVQDYDYTVFVVDNSNFTMTGGKITGGETGVLAVGNVTLTGGVISGNNIGVHVSENISISGNPVITGNTEMNADLRSSVEIRKINITGALTDGANIGITVHTPTDNSPVTVTNGYNTYNSVSPDTYFSLDNDGQIQTSPFDYMTVVMGWNEDRTEVAVGTALYTVNFDMNGHGDAIDAVSLLNGCKVAEPTEPTADEWFFVDWFTDDGCTAGNEYDFDNAVTSDLTLHARWTQEAIYSIILPENMVIVSTTNAPVGGKYPVGTEIKFKLSSEDYVVDGDVKNGDDVLTTDDDGNYTVTMGDADITITATVKKAVEPNKTLSGSDNYTAQDGDVLTGSTSGTVTIADNAKITLSDVTITGGIVCEGTADITLVGTNSVTGASLKAGIQVGGSGTTLTIKGNGSLTANGGSQSAGIGLSCAWDVDAMGGDIVIEGGNITATGDDFGAGIGTGVSYGNGTDNTATIGNITIKGGTVKAIGGTNQFTPGSGIGKGGAYSSGHAVVGTITIYDGIDMVDASSISESVTYMHDKTDVTANASNYFTITEDGDHRIIVPKDDTDYTITIANDIEHGTLTGAATAKYMEKVTITATSDLGYRLSRLVVKDAQNNDVATTGNSFFMPKGNVTVSAVFEQGTHGTTEFKLSYNTGGPHSEVEETIYDGVTTINLQQGRSYSIIKNYDELLIDNDEYQVSIPYSGGTGTFVQNGTSFNNNGDAGFYDITMTDAGNDKWSVSILKTVGVIDNIPDQTYTGSEIKPEPLVRAGSLNLSKGTDYEYSYSDNTNVGTAKVTVTFKGDYASLGSVEKEFNIVRATPTVTAPTAVENLVFNGNEQELVTAGSTDFGTVLYSLDGTNYSEKVPKGTNAGKYTVYYKVEGSDNWNAVEPQTVTAKIGYSDGIGEHLAGHSLSLNGNIGVNFYMELDDAVVADENAYMQFTLPNGDTPKVLVSEAAQKTVGGKTYYVFQCSVAAKEMTDTITAQMFSGEKQGEEYSYTVKQYADYLFANAYEADGTTVKNQAYADAIKLIEAMVNYGAYSQLYFDHNIDSLANVDITATNVSGVTAGTVNKAYVGSSNTLPDGVSLAGANLELESETVMNLYFTNITGKALTFTTSGNVALMQEQSGEYTKVTITGIAAQYLDSDVTVNVALEGDDKAYSVKYSPMNYCYNVIARAPSATRTEALKDVMRAFYLYNKEAKAYFASHNN